MSETLPPESQAARLFNSIITAPSPSNFLKALVNSSPPTYEEEWLDFKGAGQLTAPKNPNKDECQLRVKEIWSEALSGFANTQGGVLIWGIDARKDPQGRDVASGFNQVYDPFEFKTRMMDLHGAATDPPISGIRVEPYEDSDKPGYGFVVCYVPESLHRPHRAEFAGRRYCIRVGDDFRDAPVSFLRLLFYPQSRARLIPRIKTELASACTQLKFFLSNTGTATASDVSVWISHGSLENRYGEAFALSMPDQVGYWRLMRRKSNSYQIHGGESIHPGDSSHFYTFTVGAARGGDINFRMRLELTIDVFCKDGEPLRWNINLSSQELLNANELQPSPVKSLSFELPALER